MKTSDFDYVLPPAQIAQTPVEPRDHARLLVVDRKTGETRHRRFFEIGEELRPGDLLVANDSRVFKARLTGTLPTGGAVEIFLLRPEPRGWLALGKPGRKLTPGTAVTFAGTSHRATVLEKRGDGTLLLDFGATTDDVFELADRTGDVPLPPYIAPGATLDRYQTVYAADRGSAAAPTAGLHFTPELISRLKTQGIGFATVTLHVGLGTFRPVTADEVEAHDMHEEWFSVPAATRESIAETRARGGRVVCVGTTTVRALESDGDAGFTKIFLTPGYRFKNVDALITNFHLPKSTLLMLVSAFAAEAHPDDIDAGRKLVLRAYDEAVREGYRFFSFGDASLFI